MRETCMRRSFYTLIRKLHYSPDSKEGEVGKPSLASTGLDTTSSTTLAALIALTFSFALTIPSVVNMMIVVTFSEAVNDEMTLVLTEA